MKVIRFLAMVVIASSASAFAQCAAFPCVVASISLTNQSQAVKSAPMFTPTVAGVFRISGYVSTSAGTNSSAEWAVYLGWTDNHGPKQLLYGATHQNASDAASPITVQDVAGQPLLYQTVLYGGGQGSGGMTYDLFLVVEQLQ